MQTVFIVAMLITIACIPFNIAIDYIMSKITPDVEQVALKNKNKKANISPLLINELNFDDHTNILYGELLSDIKQYRLYLKHSNDSAALALFDKVWKYELNYTVIM